MLFSQASSSGELEAGHKEPTARKGRGTQTAINRNQTSESGLYSYHRYGKKKTKQWVRILYQNTRTVDGSIGDTSPNNSYALHPVRGSSLLASLLLQSADTTHSTLVLIIGLEDDVQ